MLIIYLHKNAVLDVTMYYKEHNCRSTFYILWHLKSTKNRPNEYFAMLLQNFLAWYQISDIRYEISTQNFGTMFLFLGGGRRSDQWYSFSLWNKWVKLSIYLILKINLINIHDLGVCLLQIPSTSLASTSFFSNVPKTFSDTCLSLKKDRHNLTCNTLEKMKIMAALTAKNIHSPDVTPPMTSRHDSPRNKSSLPYRQGKTGIIRHQKLAASHGDGSDWTDIEDAFEEKIDPSEESSLGYWPERCLQ